MTQQLLHRPLTSLNSTPQQPSNTASETSVGYLSAAARVSTDFRAISSGARAHVLGFIGGLGALGYEVHTFILGNHLPGAALAKSAESIRLNPFRALFSDLGRLSIRALIQLY